MREFRILNRKINKYIERVFNKYTEALEFIKTLDKPGMHEIYKLNGIKASYKDEIKVETFDILEERLKDLPLIRTDSKDYQWLKVYNGSVWISIWAPEYFGTLTSELNISVYIKPNKEQGNSVSIANISYHDMDELVEFVRNYKYYGKFEPLKFENIKKSNILTERAYNL